MRTETINIYQWDELSEQSQKDALNNLHDLNVDYDWWVFVYEDADSVGLKITGFDIGRRNEIDIEYLSYQYDTKAVIKMILEQHGVSCDTFKTATKFQELFNNLNTDAYEEEEIDEREEELADDFLQEIGEDYLSLLRQEYEYKISEEAVIETIKANECEFTEDGKLY